VTSANTAAPGTSPVSPESPEGMSTDTTGRPLSLIRRINCSAAPEGARENPVPNSASTQTSGSSSESGAISRTPASIARRWFSLASGDLGGSESANAASPPASL